MSKLNEYVELGLYDRIYEEYGKIIYNIFTPKYYKKEVKQQLLNNSEYQEIFNRFYVLSHKERKMLNKKIKEDIKALESENRFFTISEKYKDYDKVQKIMNIESILETGKKYNVLSFDIRNLTVYKNFDGLKSKLKFAGGFIGGTILFMIANFEVLIDSINTKNYEDNQEIIMEYDSNLEEYASKFDTDTMSTMEIIMTVMNDIRSNTKYGCNPDVNEITNYSRLVLNDSNDIGVCRNMADKFTTIMNMIDPRFKAYNVLVNLNSENTTFKTCNVEQPISDIYIESLNNPDTQEEVETDNKISANHEVTLLKPLNANYYLIVDVTNPSIGVLNNGKIYMFNSNDYSFIEYRPCHQFIVDKDNRFEIVTRNFILSNFQNINLCELEKKYGLDKQNEILEKIKNK